MKYENPTKEELDKKEERSELLPSLDLTGKLIAAQSPTSQPTHSLAYTFHSIVNCFKVIAI